MELVQNSPVNPSIVLDLENPQPQSSYLKDIHDHVGISIKEFSYPEVSTTDQIEDENHPHCPICWDTNLSKGTITLKDCHHTFCKECLAEYLKSNINSLKVTNISCPSSECKSIFIETAIRQVLDDEAFKKYQDAVLKKAVSQNTETKFCPIPGCAYQFKPSNKSLYTICICKTKVCNVCCGVWHEGKTCLEAIDPDFQMFAIDQGVKFCMICKSHVQRVEGCKHITCPICDYEWCWDCGRQYEAEHQERCIKIWSPVPPPVSRTVIWRRRWETSSKGQKIGLAIGAALLSPAILIGFLLLWPLWYRFNLRKHLNKRNPLKSIGVIVMTMFLAVSVVVVGMLSVLFFYFCSPLILEWKFRSMDSQERSINDSQHNTNQRRWIRRNAENFTYTANARPQNNT